MSGYRPRTDWTEYIGCAMMLGLLALWAAFWLTVAYIVLHFVWKYW